MTINPSDKSRLPNCELSPALIVPVVVRFSFPKLIAPEESVIDPLANIKVPKVVPVADANEVLRVVSPVTVKEPSTIRFSLILINEESLEEILVPENPIASILTLPEPLADIIMSSLVLMA